MYAIAVRDEPVGIAAQGIRILRAHRWLIAVSLVYVSAGMTLAGAFGLAERVAWSGYAVGMLWLYGVWIVAFALGYPIHVMLFVRPARLTRHILHDLKTRYLTFERLFSAFLVLALLPFFVATFTSIKVMIPLVNPFGWDPTFMAWDRWLHGGHHPWELLQPLLGHPLTTSAINAVYHLWFFLLYGLLLWQAFALQRPRLRMQFLLSFALSWALLGSLGATIFASAGPCYYGAVTGLEDPFAPLMAYLRAANESYPVWALAVQERLWDGYQAGSAQLGGGISAMPSMHVSSALLFALLGGRVHRMLGAALWLFLVLVLIGSVHLGWHYAIDGYLAIPATWLIWAGLGRLLGSDPAPQPAR